MNPFSIIKYQLYLLQLENYELGRYFTLLRQKGFWPKGDLRKALVWTAKARAVLLVAMALDVLLAIILAPNGRPYTALIIGLVLFFFLPFIFFTIAAVLLYPVDAFLKARIIARAKSK